MKKLLELSQIRIDGDTQPREEINQATVDEYATAMRQLVSFPPVVVYHDGVNTWLADGFHRYHAGKKIGASALDVEWRVGTLEQAKLYAASANTAHGLRRTDGDRRRAVEMVLSTGEGRGWRQEKIAEHCGVDQSYVSRVKANYDSHNAPKSAPPAASTRMGQKRAAIAGAAAANPEASDRALARQLGVNRRTVASVRGQAKKPSVPRGGSGLTPAAEVPSRTYSTTSAEKAARAALVAMRAARAVLTDREWKALLAEIGAIA